MEAAQKGIKASGSARNLPAVAAAQWKKMSKEARAPWEILRTLRESGAEIVPGNPGPAVLPLAAGAAARTIANVVTGDLIVLRTEIPRGTKKNPLPPWIVETHINPMAIGLGGLAVALAAFVGIIAWEGVPLIAGRTPSVRDWFEGRAADRGVGGIPRRETGESLACFLCRTLFFPANLPACAACAAGL